MQSKKAEKAPAVQTANLLQNCTCSATASKMKTVQPDKRFQSCG